MTDHELSSSPRPLPKPPVSNSPQYLKPPLPKPPLPKRPGESQELPTTLTTTSELDIISHRRDRLSSPPPTEPIQADSYRPPYRSPEKVEDDELPPDAHEAITEHVEFADDFKQPPGLPPAYATAMDVDEVADKAQVGPGLLPRRLLEVVHPHNLIKPLFDEWHLRESTLKPLPVAPGAEAAPVEEPSSSTSAATLDDVVAAVPGGRSGEWYFCTVCWAWLRVAFGHGEISTLDSDEWHKLYASKAGDGVGLQEAAVARQRELSRFNDILAQRVTLSTRDHHFHGFNKLQDAPDYSSAVVFIPSGQTAAADAAADVPAGWLSVPPSETHGSSLYVSCCSDAWLVVDHDMVPAQIPKQLADDYRKLKAESPSVGWDANRSIFEGWSIWALLLSNAAIEGDTRWVGVTGKSFQRKAGWGSLQSHIADAVHFGYSALDDKQRIGPRSDSNDWPQLQVAMLRAWVEVSLYIWNFFNLHEIKGVAIPLGLQGQSLAASMTSILDPYPLGPLKINEARRPDLDLLGASVCDTAATIVSAYELQISCDSANAPEYLGALQAMSTAILTDVDLIGCKASIESSMGKFSKADVEKAYALIGYTPEYAENIGVAPEDAPDVFIFKQYREAGAKPNTDRKQLQEALTTIAKFKESDYLANIAAIGTSGLMTLSEAYRNLSLPEESTDEGVIMQYQEAIKEFPHRKEHFKMCMTIIAECGGEARAGIKFYLDKGDLDMEEQPVRKDLPVGLHNIGNTCYLNSILQYLYAIKPLREAVVTFDKSDAADETQEVQRSRRFVRQLRDLFLQLGRSDLAAIRPEQELAYLAITRPEDDEANDPSAAEAINPSPSSTVVDVPSADMPTFEVAQDVAIPDVLTSPRPEPERRTSVLGKRASQDRDEDEEPAAKSEKMDVEMASLPSPPPTPPVITTEIEAAQNQTAIPPPLPPRPKAFNPNSLKFGLQQDSAEVLINVLNQLELALDPVEIDGREVNLVQSLFSCKFRQQTVYADQEAQTPVESVFVPPILGVEEEGKDVYDCLAELYLQGEEIEYEGRKGVKMDLMDTLPPLLYVQMRRSQYDFATGRESKTNTHVGFDRTLNMDRFLASADPARRQQSIEMTRTMATKRSRLHALTKAKPMDMPTTFEHVKDSLAALDLPELGVDAGLLDALQSEAERIRAEINDVQTELRSTREALDRLWADEHSTEYELMAVFMHRGKSSGAGHYWTYQAFLPDQPERFFKYNDAEVTEVPMSEVLQDRTGQDANPALLCYVRKDTGLVQTLCRE